jgi:hypothetical protein
MTTRAEMIEKLKEEKFWAEDGQVIFDLAMQIIHSLQKDNELLRDALKQCKEELHAEIAEKYKNIMHYPSIINDYIRDMEAVRLSEQTLAATDPNRKMEE